MPTEIRNEQDLFRAIEPLRFDGGDEEAFRERPASYVAEEPSGGIQFVGWPSFRITICGERFDGGIPARLMPALYKYQLMSRPRVCQSRRQGCAPIGVIRTRENRICRRTATRLHIDSFRAIGPCSTTPPS